MVRTTGGTKHLQHRNKVATPVPDLKAYVKRQTLKSTRSKRSYRLLTCTPDIAGANLLYEAQDILSVNGVQKTHYIQASWQTPHLRKGKAV